MPPRTNASAIVHGPFFRRGLLVVALLALPLASRAQVQNPAPSVDKARPIVVKSSPPPKPKTAWFAGNVISSTSESMTVRRRDNARVIRTFAFSQDLHTKMVQRITHGGYQYGDKVEIEYAQGSDVALNIKGKPSTPKTF